MVKRKERPAVLKSNFILKALGDAETVQAGEGQGQKCTIGKPLRQQCQGVRDERRGHTGKEVAGLCVEGLALGEEEGADTGRGKGVRTAEPKDPYTGRGWEGK